MFPRFVHRLLVLAAVVASLFVARTARAGALQDLAAKAKLSVVLLTMSDGSGQKIGSGTGFFVSTDGLVVTNHHVIEHAAQVTASLADGTKIEALGILADDPDNDLAVIKLPGSS